MKIKYILYCCLVMFMSHDVLFSLNLVYKLYRIVHGIV